MSALAPVGRPGGFIRDMIPAGQQEAAALLANMAGRAAVETHISAVFLGADTVWKLKKSVRLAFLDFSTLAAREHFLRRELELNSKAAPGMYRDVAPILRGPDGRLRLGEPGEGVSGEDASGEDASGEVIDWVLRMALVPEGDFLDVVAARGGLTPLLLDQMADAVAALHAGLKPERRDLPAAMRAIMAGNALAARDAGIAAEAVARWESGCAALIAARTEKLDARDEAGMVRRAHGDLHLGNLCLWQGRPVPFDALEFDEDLATIDTGYDLAFLLMDLRHRAGPEAANRVLNRYVARTGDAGLVGLLPLYLSLRAMIRAHVEARKGLAYAQYLDEALAYLMPAHGSVVAVGGLQGTGKSTLARALAPDLGPAPGALVLRSDEIRKRLHGAAPEQRLPPEAYGREANARTNAALMDLARQAAQGGQAVILDATFLDLGQREAAEALAAEAGMRFTGLWLAAPLDLLEARIAARHDDASDATVAVLRQSAAHDPGAGSWQAIDARDAATALEQARRCLSGQ